MTGLILVGSLLLTILALWLFGERWRPLRRSTWRFLREGGLRRLLNGSALHAYAYGREKLAAYKVPRYVEFRCELPKSMVGKVLRRELVAAEGR